MREVGPVRETRRNVTGRAFFRYHVLHDKAWMIDYGDNWVCSVSIRRRVVSQQAVEVHLLNRLRGGPVEQKGDVKHLAGASMPRLID